MSTLPTQPSLDCKRNFYPTLLRCYGEHATGQIQKLEEFVARLEEEKLKIDTLKRELPLCMQLLTSVMEASQREVESQRRLHQGTRPELEEFIPLKMTTTSSSVTETDLSVDKANWMASAQLWHTEIEGTNPCQSPLSSNSLVPFSSKDDKDSSSTGAVCPELALASSHKGRTEDGRNSTEAVSGKQKSCTCGNTASICGAAIAKAASETRRKARRSWSPDLHRRFVDALHVLGGSQVATPKLIRELMKVDGLTNDEVKSHLQKFRLHTRSPSRRPQTAVTGQLVVLGGVWVPPEYVGVALAGAPHTVSPPFFSMAPFY